MTRRTVMVVLAVWLSAIAAGGVVGCSNSGNTSGTSPNNGGGMRGNNGSGNNSGGGPGGNSGRNMMGGSGSGTNTQTP